MVLSAYDLSEDLGITPADIEKMRKESSLYSFLEKKRRFGRRDDLERVKKTIDDAEKLHYETLSFIQNAESNRRSEALAFLFERNGIAFPVKTTASQDDVLSRKEKFKRDKMERLRLYQKREKERRQVEDEFTFTGNNHLLMLLDGNAKPTHYDILGVPQNAPVAMISKAFRRLSLIYHPDKTKNVSK